MWRLKAAGQSPVLVEFERPVHVEEFAVYAAASELVVVDELLVDGDEVDTLDHRLVWRGGPCWELRIRGHIPPLAPPLEQHVIISLAVTPVAVSAWDLLAIRLLREEAKAWALASGCSPLESFKVRTLQSWESFEERLPQPERRALAIAGMVEHKRLLVDGDLLAQPTRDVLAIIADGKQQNGEPGGLVLAHWLNDKEIAETVVLEDLRRWCDALLAL
jgi:hypothetical protein